jgi:transmembrane sensor
MKNQTGGFMLFVSTRAFAKRLSVRLLHRKLDAPEKRQLFLIYAKAIAVGVACIFILVFPLFYFSLRSTTPVVPIVQKTPSPETKWKQIAAESRQVITLPDGSVATLQKGSSLSYPDNFNLAERKVKSSGEVYFEVKHNDAKPFEITTATAVIYDLGTAFLLRSTDTLQEVTVTEGAVYLTSRMDPLKSITLLPGQTGVVMGSNLYKKTTKAKNKLANYTKVLQFQNTPLVEVAADLSRYYHTPVTLSPSLEKKNIGITAQFRTLPLEEVLILLQKEHNLVVKRNKEGYILMRENFVQRIMRQLN